jgi:uncharacterized membrane protein YgcG
MKSAIGLFLFWMLCVVGVLADRIEQYDTDVTIEQNGSVRIVEQIDYDFGETMARHGIVRAIPYTEKSEGVRLEIGLRIEAVWQDGAIVSWEEERLGGTILSVRIGDPHIKLTGTHRYTIAYRIGHAVLPASASPNPDTPSSHSGTSRKITAEPVSGDMIRLDVIPTEWPVEIVHAHVTIHLPSSLSAEEVNATFYRGGYGSTQQLSPTWSDPHTLTVATEALQAKEGMTGAFVYPAGRLEQTAQNHRDRVAQTLRIRKQIEQKREQDAVQMKKTMAEYDRENLIHHGAHTQTYRNIFLFNWVLEHFYWVVMLFGGYLYWVFGSFDRVSRKDVPVQYRPPEGFSVLQSGLLVDKYADQDDVTAAIIELAQQGHLTITQEEDVPVLIRQTKPTEGLSADQIYLLDAVLFSEGTRFEMTTKEHDEASRLARGFETLTSDLYAWAKESHYLKSDPVRTRRWFGVVTAIVGLLVFWFAYYTITLNHDVGSTLGEIGTNALAVVALLSMLGLVFVPRSWVRRWVVYPLACVWLSMLGVHLFVAHDSYYGAQLWWVLGMGLVLIVLIDRSVERLGHLTRQGVEVQRHLLGLREFVKRADNDRIRRLLAEDPQYLERMLPYVMVFGLSEHWLEQFSLYDVAPPTWQKSSLSVSTLRHAVHSTSIVPSVSGGSGSYSGGGYSGGGGSYSGGGMGGGGGGTW